MDVQIITTPAGEQLVVLPRFEFEALLARVAEAEAAEDAPDTAAFDAGMADETGRAPDETGALLRHGLLRALRKARGKS